MAWTTVDVATDTSLFSATDISAAGVGLFDSLPVRSSDSDYGCYGTMVQGPWGFASITYNTVFGTQYELDGNTIVAKSGGGGPTRPTTGILYPLIS